MIGWWCINVKEIKSISLIDSNEEKRNDYRIKCIKDFKEIKSHAIFKKIEKRI